MAAEYTAVAAHRSLTRPLDTLHLAILSDARKIIEIRVYAPAVLKSDAGLELPLGSMSTLERSLIYQPTREKSWGLEHSRGRALRAGRWVWS